MHLNAFVSWALWDDEPIDGAFELKPSASDLDQGVVSSVTRPWLFGFEPTIPNAHKKAILITGGGGYVELMVGREGIKVARWLSSLGFYSFVLIHRFPNSTAGAQAPIDDARRALRVIAEKGYAGSGIALCGLSSGGHLAASLLAEYPSTWTERTVGSFNSLLPKVDFAIIGYAPISTNAAGRHIVSNKAPLPPVEKQALYNAVQPDAQLLSPVPPLFIVYAGNDPVVPVVNAYRLAQAAGEKGALVETHVFADAPHGFGVDTAGKPVGKWMEMCEAWMRQGGWL